MESDQLLFTSGGTEANNLALMGLASLRPGAIVVSSIEHPSVLAAAEHLERSGRRVLRLPCDSSGVIALKPLTEWLEQTMEPVSLVSLMLANNETGVLQQVKAAAELCRARAVPIHCDAVQGLGKIPMRFDSLGLTR
jgi:cysteine desulfurase